MNSEINKPPSHKTFSLGTITISSEFDSGNLSYVQKVSFSSYNLWIGTDHPQNNYRTWFYFSVHGFSKSHTVNFNIKNMHNQSRLLNEGLLPVYRTQSSDNWKRIHHPINCTNMFINNDGFLQFTFKHTFESEDKVFFAFFYPWALEDNKKLLNDLEMECKSNKSIYFHRTLLINSFQNRPVDLVVISSMTKITKKQEQIQDKYLFPRKNKPRMFTADKKVIFISARVHPGQVPSSFVMNGILKKLVQDDEISNLLRQKFIFYIVPIINPDGVFRGHYRTDKNGINLNRFYINPSPKDHSPIYAIKKLIVHLHQTKRFFSSLDLHAHAGRKGMFIYGNYSNQLKKQLDICIFPKILSLNSKNFEYQASNFTEQNMYCKDKSDPISKEGSARVALFRITKNPYCWTLQCNYNMNRIQNEICEKSDNGAFQAFDQNKIDNALVCNYQNLNQVQPKTYYTIETYENLGKEILDSYLDLIECHPYSRINNLQCKFKNITYLKLNLLVGLMKMIPYHFQSNYRKLITAVQSEKEEMVNRSVRALYQIFIKDNKIENIQQYLKNDVRQLSPLKKQIRIQKLSSNFQLPSRKRRNTILLNESEKNLDIQQKNELKASLVGSKSEINDQQTLVTLKSSIAQKRKKQMMKCFSTKPQDDRVINRLKEYFERNSNQQVVIANIQQMAPTLKVVNLKILKNNPINQLSELTTSNLSRVPTRSLFTKKVSYLDSILTNRILSTNRNENNNI